MEIRSYHKVFDLERRVYRVERLRLNPTGVPVRGLVYFVAAVVASVLLARLPLIGGIVALLPWYIRVLAAPALAAATLASIRVEGRTFHLTAAALTGLLTGSHEQLASAAPRWSRRRWEPADVIVLPDGSDRRLRSFRYTGPGVVVVAREHLWADGSAGLASRLRLRGSSLMLSVGPGEGLLARPRVVALAEGASLRVRGVRPIPGG